MLINLQSADYNNGSHLTVIDDREEVHGSACATIYAYDAPGVVAEKLRRLAQWLDDRPVTTDAARSEHHVY